MNGAQKMAAIERSVSLYESVVEFVFVCVCVRECFTKHCWRGETWKYLKKKKNGALEKQADKIFW